MPSLISLSWDTPISFVLSQRCSSKQMGCANGGNGWGFVPYLAERGVDKTILKNSVDNPDDY